MRLIPGAFTAERSGGADAKGKAAANFTQVVANDDQEDTDAYRNHSSNVDVPSKRLSDHCHMDRRKQGDRCQPSCSISLLRAQQVLSAGIEFGNDDKQQRQSGCHQRSKEQSFRLATVAIGCAIETVIVLSSGMVDKLEIYRGLGVMEIWVWEAERFRIHHLRANGYECIARSELLPDCDIELLANFVKPEEQFDAVMAFREELQRRSQRSERKSQE